MKIKYVVAAIGLTALVSAQAALIGEYSFDDTGSGTVAERMVVAMQSSSMATGAALSQLGTNTIQTLNFVGFNNLAWPSDEDAFSFGGAGSGQVMFFKRAENGFATAWGAGGLTTATHSPLSFTLTADAGYSITVDSLTVGSQGAMGSATLWAFQEENAAQGAFVEVPGSLGSATASLAAPVVIAEGTSKTFTMSVNSYVHGAAQYLDYLQVNGSVAAIPEPATIGLIGVMGVALIGMRRFRM